MTTFTNARVFDGRKALPGRQTVTLEGNRIASVTQGPAPEGAIDLDGMTLMPGLITCHFHTDFYKFTLADGGSGEQLDQGVASWLVVGEAKLKRGGSAHLHMRVRIADDLKQMWHAIAALTERADRLEPRVERQSGIASAAFERAPRADRQVPIERMDSLQP